MPKPSIAITAINTADDVDDVYFWSGSGLTTDSDRAKLFNSPTDAFVEWNEHAASFPGFEADLEDMNTAARIRIGCAPRRCKHE